MRKAWLMIVMVMANTSWGASQEARLAWARRVDLSTPVSGLVAKVPVRPGDSVHAGQPLVVLDERLFQARVEGARAAVDRASQSRKEAQRELDRARELYDRTLLSNHELELAKIALATADADYRAAQANLVRAQLELEYSSVRAPFDGVVVRRNVDEGQTVVTRLEAAPLISVAQRGKMLALALVDGDQVARLQVGQPVTVHTAGREFPGTVRHIGLEPAREEQGKVWYDLEVVFDVDAALQLRAGQSATLNLPP